MDLVYTDRATPKANDRFDNLKKHLDNFQQELTATGITRKVLWEDYLQVYPEGYY